MMRAIQLAVACVAVLAATAGQVQGGVITYQIEDVGPFAAYLINNTGQSYSGPGFIGMYSSEFAHLFRLEESANVAQNNLVIDISALAGSSIHSAFLSFRMLDSVDGTTNFNIDGYNSDGQLRHLQGFNGSDYGSLSFATDGTTAIQQFDITSILTSAVAASENWLGLSVYRTSGDNQWTYTYSGYGDSPDEAQVRLAVDFGSTATVPEPSSLAIFGIGACIVGVGVARRRRGEQQREAVA